MVYLAADHIITPLGEGVRANIDAILSGRTQLQSHEDVHGEPLVEPVVASLIEAEAYRMDGYTLYESLCIRCIMPFVASFGEKIASDRCVFVLSSTKGDIWTPIAETAAHIATYFGNKVLPVVASTACTSGVSAQLAAWRMLESGRYDMAVVVGTDVQREFIVSGFQSFKALSSATCRPFDAHRDGLNAGEAVAAMLLSTSIAEQGNGWQLLGGSIHNDANHISGPSRTAEGSLRCLKDAIRLLGVAPSLVSVHGTGTPYNDEMESIALHRAGLSDVPVSALKGFFGHTMGAAGLLETILCLHASDEGIVLPAKGYEQQGTTYPVSVSSQPRAISGQTMVKLLSGFGGVNAAVAWGKGAKIASQKEQSAKTEVLASVSLEPSDDLVALYRESVGNYPKFFKMDTLSRLGFVGVELLLQKVREQLPDFEFDPEHCALILANRSASLKNDTDYQATIADKANYFPSPSLFVYTLPNIVAGEIAIRHHLYGETAFYVLDNASQLEALAADTFAHSSCTQAVVGWVECPDAAHYQANFELRILN